MEKAGGPPMTDIASVQPAIHCAENIARQWMWEHAKRSSERSGIRSYPGDSTFPVNLMPAALWLGVRKYAGIWFHGSVGGRFSKHEVHGYLGDSRLAVLSDAIGLFSVGAHSGAAWRPVWYRGNFMHWAVNLVDYTRQRNVEFVMELSRRGQETGWCELEGCPYPYVTRRSYGFQSADILNPEVARVSRVPEAGDYRSIRPHWGARRRRRQPRRHLNRDGDEVESGDEGVMRDITNGFPE